MFKDENRHYSLRKLSVGLASVLIGISFASSMNSSSVKADTVESGSNSVQTVAKGSDAAIKTDAKDDANAIESNTESADEASKDIKQKATKGDVSETAMKNATDGSQIAAKSTLKGNVNADKDNSSKVAEKGSSTKDNSLTANNNPLKDTVEADKQGLEMPEVLHNNSNETTLNVNGSKAEVKESQNLNDPAKSKLKTATLMTTTGKKFNTKMLFASKVVSPAKDTNGGFDEATWGKLDVNDWKGSVQGDYYQLTDYTGDANHVIVPNEADFTKAGISTSGKQVGVTSDLMHTIFRDKTTAQDATVAFSKTGNKMVKAIGTDWHNTWGYDAEYVNGLWIRSKGTLTKFDGSNLDVANVTDMNYMFSGNQISDLSPLANWNVNNVTSMREMFHSNRISDLGSLANWKINNVTSMREMFEHNHISDLSPLANWNVNNVTDMNGMFYGNRISDLSPLANWKVDNVTNINDMFHDNSISDLSPLANWDTSKVTDMSYMFYGNSISDLSPLANWNTNKITNMSSMFMYNSISDLSPLANWNTGKVTDTSYVFYHNNISDLSPLANWKVDHVTNMSSMFGSNYISDLSPLANWKTDNVTNMSSMFDNNVTTQTKNLQAKRVINFAYPDGYTGKPQDPVTQTIDVPQKVKVELITQNSKPSNNILDWVTKKETPISTLTDPVYFQYYTVPTVSNLVPSISTVAKQEADPNMPLNVVVTYTAAPVTVHFVDTDENADKDSDAVKNVLNQTMQLSGIYGSNVDLSTVKLPANFVVDDTLPSVQYGKTDSVTINLRHYINDVKAENAEDATRTIVINKYDGHGNLASTQTVVQQIAFYKHDYVDAVTNNVKSSKYIFDDKSSPALSHNLVDGKATNDPSYTLRDGKYYFAKYKLDVPAGYKAEEKKINPNMMMISLFALPTTLTDPNTSQTDTNKKTDTSSSSVTDKANNSHDSHDDSKKQNDQPITSNKENDHTINVSAQAVDPTVEPEKNNVTSSNNSTTSAQTQQSSTNDAEQVKNTSIDVPSREENNANKGSNSSSNRSKPDSGKIIHADVKSTQNGSNKLVRGQSVATHPATSVIKPSKSVSNNSQLPQTGENDGYQYTFLGVLLGLNGAMVTVGAEKKRKKY